MLASLVIGYNYFLIQALEVTTSDLDKFYKALDRWWLYDCIAYESYGFFPQGNYTVPQD